MTENFQLFLNVLMYFLNFKGIICLMFVVTLNSSYFQIFTQITKNWQLQPIIDVVTIHSKICPDGYSFLFNYQWPGTKEGCDCMNKFNLTGFKDNENKIKQGPCSSLLVALDCKSLKKTDLTFVNSWNNLTICAKRGDRNYLFSYSNNLVSKQKCPLDKKSCGEIDSLGNLLCLNKTEKCPLNNIVISKKLGNQNIKDEKVKLAIEFEVSQGKVCINKNETNTLTDSVFDLVNNKKNFKCTTKFSDDILETHSYDQRFFNLTTIKTIDYFLQNELIHIYNDLVNINSFPKAFFDYDISLYSRNYIGWHKSCERLIHKLLEVEKILSRIESISTFYLIFSLIILIYCMLFIMILKELLHAQYYLNIGIILFYSVIVSLIVLLLIYDFFCIRKSRDTVEIIVRKGCSDHLTNLLFKYILSSINEIERLFILTIIFYISMFLLSILKLCLTYYKKYKRKLLRILSEHNSNNTIELALLM